MRPSRAAGARFIIAAATGLDPLSAESFSKAGRRSTMTRFPSTSAPPSRAWTGPASPSMRFPRGPSGLVRSADANVERARGRPASRLWLWARRCRGRRAWLPLRALASSEGIAVPVSLLRWADGAARLSGRVGSSARRARGIELRCGVSVARASADHVELEGGEIIPADAPGCGRGEPAGSSTAPGSERDPAGFVRVRATLQAVGHDEIFAVGDCASLLTDPGLPKAGVYAVRKGPTLIANLRARHGWFDALPAANGFSLAAHQRRAGAGPTWAWLSKGARLHAQGTGRPPPRAPLPRCWDRPATCSPEFAPRRWRRT